MGLGKGLSKGLDLLDKIVPDKDKKQEIAEKIIHAELSSDMSWVKMARPSIIYFGLLVIALEILGLRFIILQWIDADTVMVEASTSMLRYFLITWGSMVSIYIGGRSYEKAKMKKLG